jgi:hypothetical protein
MAAATVLLEHLLQHHPKKMLAVFRQELRRGDRYFAAAVSSCWNFGRGVSEPEIEKIIAEASTRSRKSLPPNLLTSC